MKKKPAVKDLNHVELLILRVSIISVASVAIFFRFWKLGNMSGLNGDEANCGVMCVRLLHLQQVPLMTQDGHPASPFYLLPVMAMHFIFDPSIVVLRMPAVLSALAALPVNFLFCKRTFDARTAWISTIALTVLPMDIVYSRISWEPSQTLLITICLIYCSLLIVQEPRHPVKWTVCAFLALIAAVITQPTNVFVTPFLGLALVYRWRKSLIGLLHNTGRKLLALVLAIVIAVVALGFVSKHFPSGWSRVLDSSAYLLFAQSYIRILSGINGYRYTPGSCYWTPDYSWTDIVTGLVLLASTAYLIWKIRREALPLELLSLISFGIGLGGLFFVAGAAALDPSVGRWGLWMIAPSVLLVARSMALTPPAIFRWLTPIGLIICLVFCVGFYFSYFKAYEETGGLPRGRNTFRTAEVDAKLTAFNYIRQHSYPGAETWIISSEWWNYWPLRYFAIPEPRFLVIDWPKFDERRKSDPNFLAAERAGRCWFVEFAGGPAANALQNALTTQKVPSYTYTVEDYAHEPLLSVIHVLPSQDQP